MEYDPLKLGSNRSIWMYNCIWVRKGHMIHNHPYLRVTLVHPFCTTAVYFRISAGTPLVSRIHMVESWLESVAVDMQTSRVVRTAWWWWRRNLALPPSVSSSMSTEGCRSAGEDGRTSPHVTCKPARSMLLLQVWTLFISMQPSQNGIWALCAS